MSLYDFLIIYLSCGAPLGVYYFLQNRKTLDFRRLWLKTILNFLFWMPFALRLFRQSNLSQGAFKNVFGRRFDSDAKFEKNIRPLQKRLEKIYLESALKLTIYEFREIVERYTGLTRAKQFEHTSVQIARTENDLFQIVGHKNAALAQICLERRNRKRLFLHQTGARRDFLSLLAELFDSSSNIENLSKSAIEFVTALNDPEALTAIEKMFDSETQTRSAPVVKDAETEIWIAETHKPLITREVSARLKSMTTAAMNLRGKD